MNMDVKFHSFIYEVKNFLMENPIQKNLFTLGMELSICLIDKTRIVSQQQHGPFLTD